MLTLKINEKNWLEIFTRKLKSTKIIEIHLIRIVKKCFIIFM